MKYSKGRLVKALEADGIRLTKKQIVILDPLFSFMAELLVKIYFHLKTTLDLPFSLMKEPEEK
jgi:hypothetical protein